MAMNVQMVSTTNKNNTGYKQEVTENAAHVIETVVGTAQAHNREFAAVSTRQSCTWTTPVKEITITAFAEAATTATLNLGAVTFDAPSDVVAGTWLTHASSTAADSNLYVLPIGVPRTFHFSSAGITRLDVIRLYGSDAIGIVVEAA